MTEKRESLMSEKVCSHCGSTLLTGLQYCPWCLQVIEAKAQDPVDRIPAWDKLQTSIDRLIGVPEGTDATPIANPTLALSPPYTRIVCPKCQRPQQAPITLSPSELIICHSCNHPFPGSFAAEFRKGADLECFRCGITTFCVSGLKVTACPNCKSHPTETTEYTGVKLGVLGGLVGSLFFISLVHAVLTKTTPQFLIVSCLAALCSVVGFATLATLGY